MNLDDELRRLFRDERLDVPVPEGMHQAIFERVRKRRQRRRRPAWFAGGATAVVLVGGGVAFGSGMDVPLLGNESGDERPAVISESSRPTTTTRLDVPVPLEPGRPQFVPDQGQLQQREPQRLSPKPSQGGTPPPLQQLLCADVPPGAPAVDTAPESDRGELAPGADDPCAAPPERDPLRPMDLRPFLPADPSDPTDPTEPTEPTSPSSHPSQPPDPPSSSTPSSSTAPPPR